ncbi:MAG: LysR substrate-binding domain-containing protein [Pseudomonadota bacterium]
MTLTELRYIIAVARERHFGRAAAACFVSQPTLSVAIKKFEEELGVELFERAPTEVRLTEIGTRIVEQAQRVLEEADQLKQLAAQQGDPLAGPLRVGAIHTIGPYLFPRLIGIMHQSAPQMPLLIEENYTAVLSERLKQGKLDAIVIALPFEEPNVLTLPLYDEPFVVALPAHHPWVQAKALPGDKLSEENLFMLGAGHCFRDQVLRAFPVLAQQSSAMQRSLEGGSLETIRYMVASGAGVTVLPSSAAVNDAEGLIVYRPFASPVPSRRVALAWRKSFPRPQAIDTLRRGIEACALPGVTEVLGRR